MRRYLLFDKRQPLSWHVFLKLAKVYPKKKLDKGPAFPVCLSINEIVGHFSPLNSEAADLVIKEGDVVKM